MNNKDFSLDFSLSKDGKTLLKYRGSKENVVIPDGVTSIGMDAFYCCYSLESITIPNSVISIDEFAFYNCINLESINIPNSVTSIDDYAFKYCSSLKKIDIPDSVTSLGECAFGMCDDLKSITLGSGITSIKESTFYKCFNLTNIKIGNNVTSIEDYAFDYCNKLIKNGKFKAFDIRKNGLYCIDKKYEEGKWHYVRGELELCGNGLHYVSNLFEIFDYYAGEIDKDIAIYEIETRGDDIEDTFSSKHCCRSIRLKRRIYRDELIKMLNGEI